MQKLEPETVMNWIMILVTLTLSLVIMGMVVTLMVGLFDERVDNAEIFKIITPAFSTVIGAFVGLLGGLSINKKKDEPPVGEMNTPPLGWTCPHCTNKPQVSKR